MQRQTEMRLISDRNGAIPSTDAPSGTYEVRDLSAGLGSLTMAALALDSAAGYAVRPPSAVCCGLVNPGWDPDEIEFFGTYGGSIDAIIQANDSCGGQLVNVTSGFNSWWSGNSAIAQVIKQKVTAEATGTTTGFTSGYAWEGYGSNCSNVPTTVSTPVTVAGTPDHLSVVTDTSGPLINCSSVIGRQVTMTVQDKLNIAVPYASVQEDFLSISNNSCPNYKQPAPSNCLGTTSAGQFTDTMTVNCAAVGGPNGCGWNITDEWQYCPETGAIDIGRLTDTVLINAITVNDVTTPNKIPQGTIIDP